MKMPLSKIILFCLSPLVMISIYLGVSKNTHSKPLKPWHLIRGRSSTDSLAPFIYRLRLPIGWQCMPKEAFFLDTREPIAVVHKEAKEGEVIITIHNFPFEHVQERISPDAQLVRWRRQLKQFNELSSDTCLQAFSGYHGLLFEGSGVLENGEEEAILAWALKLGDEPYYSIKEHEDSLDNILYKNLLSDVTIKARGPKQLIEKWREEIISIARSFETIEELPK
jgi:hypothetical protein